MILHLQDPVFKHLAATAKKTGMPAWVVGGFVRDCILGRPTKDVDVVVLGSGVEFAKVFADSLQENRFVSYFKNFGTAQIKTSELTIEVIGARKESYQRNSRKPLVEDGSLIDDQN
jgi:poly(A) polymerase